MYLGDLEDLEVGYPDYLDEDRKLINFEKRRRAYAIMRELQQFQQTPYIFITEPTIFKYLVALQCHPTELELWVLSTRCEAPPQVKEGEEEGRELGGSGEGWRLPVRPQRKKKKTTSLVWAARRNLGVDSKKVFSDPMGSQNE